MDYKLYSPVFCELWTSMWDMDNSEMEDLSQRDAARYYDEIHTAILNEMPPDAAERGLMEYYHENDSVDEKVRSLTVDVEVIEGELWAVATLDLAEPLDFIELDTLRDYLSGQYSDGFGEGFEQRELKVDGGTLNVHLWTSGPEFFIDIQQEFEERLRLEGITPERSPAQGALHEPGIFDDDIDCIDTSTYMTMLTDRVDANYTEYIDTLRGMGEDEITDYSAEIATMSEAHYYITQRHNFHFSELDYLLKFKDPLRVVAEAFDANRDEEHSDIMWKVFHEQDALRSDRHKLISDERDDPVATAVEAMKQELFDRLDKNLYDYRDNMIKNSKPYIYDMAAEIATEYAAWEYMKSGYDYNIGEVEYLLRFQDPLAIVASRWPSTIDGLVDITDVIEDILEDRNSHGRFALVLDAMNPSAKEKGRGADSVEKYSVIEQIRAYEKEPKEPRHDKPARDKTGPEL